MGWDLRACWRAERTYHRAFQLMRDGKPGEAARAFDEVLALLPKHARAQAQRALSLAAAGRTGEAVRAARRACELAPESHAPLLFLGQIQYDAGHREEARKALSAAARLDRENRVVQAYLGLALLSTGRHEEGVELLREHLLYGYAGLEGRLIALAEDYLWEHAESARSLEEQLTADEGGREDGPAGLGLRLASAARWVVAWPFARLRGPAAVSRLRAEEAVSVRDWDAAIAALLAAREAGADAKEIALTLGGAYLEAGRPEAAAREFAALPDDMLAEPPVALMAGAALYELGRYEEARKPLGIAAERFRQDFLPAYLRGMCDIALGKPQAAVGWFTSAAESLNPHLARKRFEEMLRVRDAGGVP